MVRPTTYGELDPGRRVSRCEVELGTRVRLTSEVERKSTSHVGSRLCPGPALMYEC